MISAVVRTFNSEYALVKSLVSLRIQRPAIDEIVVVDSGSTDQTIKIATKFGCRIVLYPKETQFNYSLSLNLGIQNCKNEQILILSSHSVLLFTDVAQIMSNSIEHFNASGVWCSYVRTKEEAKRIKSTLSRGHLQSAIFLDNFSGSNGLSNSCSMIRRSLWEQHKFVESLAACEDQEWALWNYKANKLPTVSIRHAGVYNLNRNHNKEKLVRDKVIIYTQIVPHKSNKRAIRKLFSAAIALLLRLKVQESLDQLAFIKRLIRAKKKLHR